MRITLITFSGFVQSGCDSNGAAADARYTAALDSVTGVGIRRHIEALASDDMQGREAGTAGHRKSAEYVAAEFARLGLVPLGDDNTYLQNVDFLETRLVEGSAAMVLHRGDAQVPLEFGNDFVLSGGFGRAEESVTAPLAFVGFGIQAPEYGHDDFAAVDVRGKILVEFTGAPPRFANDERAYYSSGTVKQALAAALGAAGIVTIRTPVDRQRLTWARVLHSAASPGMRWLESDGSARDGYPELTGNAMLSDSGAEKLFRLAGRELDRLFEHHAGGGTGSFELGVSATVTRRSVQRRVSSPNVLGLLPGSDGRLGGECLLFTAHLDHLGIGPGDSGDNIYNGAYDNAAGVATVIEVAGALAAMSPAPRRSIMFAAVTAEEKGLRGSDFLANHTPVAVAGIVANINVDMPYLGYPIADVVGFGVEHSTLHDALERAAGKLDVRLSPDDRPELVRLIRSDQFSFVRKGIPGLNLKPGSGATDPHIDSEGMRSAFLREHYHAPSDDLDLPFSERGAAQFARVALMLGLVVANDDAPPKWKDGDFFGERYSRDHLD